MEVIVKFISGLAKLYRFPLKSSRENSRKRAEVLNDLRGIPLKHVVIQGAVLENQAEFKLLIDTLQLMANGLLIEEDRQAENEVKMPRPDLYDSRLVPKTDTRELELDELEREIIRQALTELENVLSHSAELAFNLSEKGQKVGPLERIAESYTQRIHQLAAKLSGNPKAIDYSLLYKMPDFGLKPSRLAMHPDALHRPDPAGAVSTPAAEITQATTPPVVDGEKVQEAVEKKDSKTGEG